MSRPCRLHALYDKVYRADILGHACNLVRADKGSAWIGGVTFEAIEEKEGAIAFVTEPAERKGQRIPAGPCQAGHDTEGQRKSAVSRPFGTGRPRWP